LIFFDNDSPSVDKLRCGKLARLLYGLDVVTIIGLIDELMYHFFSLLSRLFVLSVLVWCFNYTHVTVCVCHVSALEVTEW